ncbi:aminotransferase, DegT/DnrJ/EryC1/StrS family [Campylobacter iguaniorum]|uniref:Aminotransferase, DegT/DnrJ/EryC1/StrS family n=1 Tax=Campylobacter iguaniorum TaxID=1244531 RepID=A0A076FDP5_9BACT|nr:DegT/DnrJ/EryC1/StrS family aminotransferase [Campylobacter iguaniorum]AII13934.1 aminotransferase, DegT/DnrJ/EryC1/StrS family [Campylobacter iguaniorum]
MKISIFTPPKFSKKALDIEYLNKFTDKNWIYSSNGRASIYHILKSIDVDKILIPIYICETVLLPIKKLGVSAFFYDIDMEDLNPSLESIKKLSELYGVKVVLVSSMYGNPANLIEIEKYCKENDIYMIDDGAQSFGAKLDDRFVGTFGDAGFFSFSPGKPTAGHMGSFFWSKNSIDIARTHHFCTHYFRWLDFYINRYSIYKKYNSILRKFVNIISRALYKFVNINNDAICGFEKNILGGILFSILNNKFEFRNKYSKDFMEAFKISKTFRIIKSIRGVANNHKLVMIFFESNKADIFIKFMLENNIYSSNGYKMVSDNLQDLPNAKIINKCVVELPIEDDKEKMKFIFDKVLEFENSY